MHQRYHVSHGFLSESAGEQTVAISRIVNAFFRWEFNSCEMLVAGNDVYPIDYANACPDVALTSLHYYFPWAITALVRWSTYCTVTGRSANVDLHTSRYFAIADDPDLSYDEKLAAYLAIADEHFETERYWDWCAEHLPHLEEAVVDWVASESFLRLLTETVQSTYPAHEQDEFMGHFKGLLGMWLDDQRAPTPAPSAPARPRRGDRPGPMSGPMSGPRTGPDRARDRVSGSETGSSSRSIMDCRPGRLRRSSR